MATLERRYEVAVADAEKASTDLRGRSWRTIDEVRAEVARLTSEDGFVRRWPGVHELVVVRRSAGSNTSFARARTSAEVDAPAIVLAHLDQATVLHELAHVCAGPEAGHGLPFALALCQLVRREMGFDAYGELVAALEASPLFGGLADDVRAADEAAGPW